MIYYSISMHTKHPTFHAPLQVSGSSACLNTSPAAFVGGYHERIWLLHVSCKGCHNVTLTSLRRALKFSVKYQPMHASVDLRSETNFLIGSLSESEIGDLSATLAERVSVNK